MSRGDPRLLIAVETGLALFASFTLAYHLVLVLGWPTNSALPLAGVLALALLAPRLRRTRRASFPVVRWGRAIGLGLLCGAGALLALLVQRPDPDDFDYLHRVLGRGAERPFAITDTTHWVADPRPAFSALHLVSAYEPLLADLARLLGQDPLAFAQNAPAAAGGALLPVVYLLLYREFRVRRALVATVGALGFLLLDGNVHRSFGNMALVRLWQGKVLLFTLVVPLAVLFTLRFLRRPTAGRLGLITVVTICGTGLSGSGLFLVPAAVAAAGLGRLLVRPRIRTAALVGAAGAACAYPAAIALAFAAGLLPRPTDVTIWQLGWPTTWAGNLALVVDGPATLARDAWILAALPLAVFARPLARLALGYVLAVSALFLAPWAGAFWMAAVQPAAYWRFLYLLPLPWCAGLAAEGALRRGIAPKLAALGAVGLTIVAYRGHVLRPPVTWKAPLAYRLSAPEEAFARRTMGVLGGRRILAPEEMVVAMALLDPGLRFEATRAVSTFSTFQNAGRTDEAWRRVFAQFAVSRCTATPTEREERQALGNVLQEGVDAIVARDCPQAAAMVEDAVTHRSGWRREAAGDGYVLWRSP